MYKKLFLIFIFAHTVFTNDFSELKRRHKLQNLNERQVSYLAGLSNPGYTETVLDNILIPRVVGTQNHDKVHDYIIGQLKQLGYFVEIDTFEEQTPNMGTLKFRNILGTLNPNSERYLVLSCHYDSKYFKDELFVGATDSAVPCAMMLNLAKVMQKELEQSKSNSDVSLLLVFLDGEEAFLRWTPDDSIYGARHLAQKWENQVSAARSGHSVNLLQRIDAFVLLDLLGTPNPTFFSYFPHTERLYIRLANAEDRLSEQKLLKHSRKSQRYFRRRSTPSFVEDDHIPFLRRGVPILHIIPKQFPKVWHKPEDNRDALDMDTVEDLNKILRLFVAEYLHAPVQYLKTDVDQSKTIPHYIKDEL